MTDIAVAISDRVVHPDVKVPYLANPQDTLLCDMDLHLRKNIFPLGFAVSLLTNRHEVIAAAQQSFGHRQLEHGDAQLEIRIGVSKSISKETPQPPVRREYNHLYSMVADAENQALLDLRTGSNFVWLNESALNDELYLRYNFLEKVVYLLLGASVVTDIHAGCVSKRGKGILLCGNSGAGKSTLSYACARSGWTYTSDDTCYLLNASVAPRVIGHSHRVRFRPEATTLFPELSEFDVATRLEGKPSIEVSTSELPLAYTSTEADVCAVVYLCRSPSTHASLIDLPYGSATQLLSRELYSAGEIRIKHQNILARLAGVHTFELHYHNLEQAMHQLDQLVASL